MSTDTVAVGLINFKSFGQIRWGEPHESSVLSAGGCELDQRKGYGVWSHQSGPLHHKCFATDSDCWRSHSSHRACVLCQQHLHHPGTLTQPHMQCLSAISFPHLLFLNLGGANIDRTKPCADCASCGHECSQRCSKLCPPSMASAQCSN